MRLSALISASLLLAAIGCDALVPRNRNGKCTNPSVRKEWRSLTKDEQAEWIRAVKCLSKQPHDDKLRTMAGQKDFLPLNTDSTYYDDVVFVHTRLRNTVPFTALSLPWHRWYEHVFETALKEKCGFKGAQPYWDYTIDAEDFEHASIFDDKSAQTGLGGWGNPECDNEVQDGGFASFEVTYPNPHKIRRQYTPVGEDGKRWAETFSRSEVKRLLTEFDGDFKGFQHLIENGPHTGAHYIMGGDSGGRCDTAGLAAGCVNDPMASWSSNDPVFWLQHTMVDKIWTTWQNRANNFWLFEGGSVIDASTLNGAAPYLTLDNATNPGGGLFPDLPMRELMDTTGGYLCYVYE